jgi:hypothetical protein
MRSACQPVQADGEPGAKRTEGTIIFRVACPSEKTGPIIGKVGGVAVHARTKGRVQGGGGGQRARDCGDHVVFACALSTRRAAP